MPLRTAAMRVSLLGLLCLVPAMPATAGPKEACDYSATQQGVSCLVLVDGQPVHEAYSGQGGPEKTWGLASGTKSFSGVAAAAAVQDGLIALDEKLSDTIVEWKGDARKDVTVRQMLSLTSGVRTPPPMEQLRLPFAEALMLPQEHAPGSHFAYGQAPFQIFAAFMERKLQGEKYEAYLNRRIMAPLGIKLEMRKGWYDGDPNFGGGGIMGARDWARFGEFVRLGGRWNGKQIVDARALAEIFKGTAANPAYGLTWWLKPPVGAQLPASPTMERATDMYKDRAGLDSLPVKDVWMAAGAGKQRLYIIPERKIVAVRQTARMLMGERVPYSDVEFLRLLLTP